MAVAVRLQTQTQSMGRPHVLYLLFANRRAADRCCGEGEEFEDGRRVDYTAKRFCQGKLNYC